MKQFNAILAAAAALVLAGTQVSHASLFFTDLHRHHVRHINALVLAYAHGHMGKQVGNGECWTLANEALKSAGAHQPGTNGYGVSVFGTAIAFKDLRGGDIIQFENVRFVHNANGSFSSNEFPHHTAIVQSVSGNVITVIQQNVNNDRHVQVGTINVGDKVRGTMSYFRPQPR